MTRELPAGVVIHRRRDDNRVSSNSTGRGLFITLDGQGAIKQATHLLCKEKLSFKTRVYVQSGRVFHIYSSFT